MTSTVFLIIIGTGFAFLAGIMAFLIFYAEYSRHYFMAKNKAVRISIEMALMVFIFFTVVAVIVTFVMSNAI